MEAEMAAWGDEDWGRQQAEDEAIEAREIAEAFDRLEMLVHAVEVRFEMELPGTRSDLSFLKSYLVK